MTPTARYATTPARRWLAPMLLTITVIVLSGCGSNDDTANPAAALQADGPEGPMEDFITSEMAASGAPGLAYALVDDGHITSADARGVVEAGGTTPVTPDTPFVIGSISKSFTALAIMQLVEAGEVDLDTEMSQYLDSFSGRQAGAITIRQLLSHTSGFSTGQGNAPADSGDRSDALALHVAKLAQAKPAFEPGERWEYSNTNYQILGRVIEVVTGQSYQDYVTVNILEPVGMEQSFVADGEIHNEMATGHRPWFTTKRPRAEKSTDLVTAPQGGIIASSQDLGRYMQMMINGTDDVLSADGKALMMQPANTVSPGYGLGWYLDPADGTVLHSGSTPGFETLLTIVPSNGQGAVVLVNAGSGLGFGETAQLRLGITARALDLDYDGEGSRWLQKALFVSLVLLPVVYVASMAWAWRRRSQLRAKPGMFGLFSWWFPLLTTLVSAWVIVALIPDLFGGPLRTLALFQPDLGLALIATAVSGVLWAVFRLAVAYTGGSDAAVKHSHLES